jgi:phenylacetaldehyde dehydrogenase
MSVTALEPTTGGRPQDLLSPGRLLIDGEWVESDSGARFDSIDPANESVLTDVAKGDARDVDKAVEAARKAFEEGSEWRLMTPADRGRLLGQAADLLERYADDLAILESLDTGKPAHVARAVDVQLAIEQFRYMAGWPTKIHGATIPVSQPGDSHVYTRREPVGVVAAITPWNFPLMINSWKLAPALAAGCTVILKPAEQSPLSALRLGELLLEAGLPVGVLNIVTGFGEAGAALASHRGVDKVTFTGSTEVGRKILQAAAGNMKRVTLELGGKSPNVIFADADLDATVPNSAVGAFFNSGQACSAGTRLFVEASAFDEVVEGLVGAAKAASVGPGLDPSSELGPLISDEQLRRVLGYMESGAQAGAETVVGGARIGDRGYFVEPTVLTQTSPEMSVEKEEIFGPVVCVIPFADVDELVARANDNDYGLAAGIYTRDLSNAHRVAARLKAGTVWVNSYGRVDAAVPFGGFKQSGWGRENGETAVDGFLEDKSVWLTLT